MEPVPASKETKQLRAESDERKSEWVCFPNGKLYLLPVIARHQKIVPVFGDDGSCEVVVEQGDDELANLTEKFLEQVATVHEGNIVLSTSESIAEFFALVRKLLLTTYDLAPADIKAILTVNNFQFAQLYNTIIKHVVSQ